ncbi:MAG: DUF167 family protein [Pseudohongiellaceae bacterium]
MYYQWKESVLILSCRIQTRAGTDEFAEVVDDCLKIRIKAAPVDGDANQQLIRFLSRQFKVPQKRIQIVSGANNRRKRISIEQPGYLPPALGIKEH